MSKKRIRQRAKIGDQCVWLSGETQQVILDDYLRQAIAAGLVVPADAVGEARVHKTPTVRQSVEETYAPTFIARLAPKTVVNYQLYQDLNILPFLGDMPMDQVTVATIQQFYDWMATAGEHGRKKNLNACTIRRVSGLASRIFKVAMEMKIIPETPFKHSLLNIRAEEAGHHKAMTDEEIQRVRQAIPHLQDRNERLYMGLLAYTVPVSFDMDYYTSFYLAVENTRQLDSFSQAYDDVVAAVTDALEPLGEERSQIRYEQLIDDAQSELDDARAEYEAEKADAEAELADAKQKLEDGEAELADSQQQLNDARAEIASGWAELNQQKASFNSQTASAQAQIDSGYAQVQSGQTQLDSGLAQLNTAQQQLDQGYSQLSQTEQTLNDTKAQLDASKAQLDATKSQLDGLTQGKEALFQAAAAAGLPMVEDCKDPVGTTTYGVGELVKHAVENGAKQVILGLGGSCTNDGGCGCAAPGLQ